MLLVLAGPSGTGKGTIVARLQERFPELWLSVSATTRAPRPGEIDGVDYIFVSRPEFEARVAAGRFLEWFDVHGDLKGTPRDGVAERLRAGTDVVLEIDVQGARAVRAAFPEAVLVFVRPPSRAEQRRRLVARQTDTPEQIERRLADAEVEEAQAAEGGFDAVVVNDDLDRAVAEVATILSHARETTATEGFL